jgi:LuxR family transcriptional regulator, maltose regulon positive regulatory protein
VRELSSAAVGTSADVAAYLIEEALESQSPEVRHFLLASSVLRRMSPAVCDAALQITNSAQILAALERESSFVVGLGDTGDWYRYHHLFREVLEAELRRQEPEVVRGILSRAAAWHEEQGEPGEGFDYAHACGDLVRAGRIALRHAPGLMARGQIETIRGWLARCTREQMESDPQLALVGAWVSLFSGQAAEAWRLAAAANTAGDLDVPSPDGATSLRSTLAHLRATLGSDGISQMLRDAEFVVAAERNSWRLWGDRLRHVR